MLGEVVGVHYVVCFRRIDESHQHQVACLGAEVTGMSEVQDYRVGLQVRRRTSEHRHLSSA